MRLRVHFRHWRVGHTEFGVMFVRHNTMPDVTIKLGRRVFFWVFWMEDKNNCLTPIPGQR